MSNTENYLDKLKDLEKYLLTLDNLDDALRFEKQIEYSNPITFGSPINVLLICSSAFNACARMLRAYLGNSTDIKVDMVTDVNSVNILRTFAKKPYDFMIFSGYQENAGCFTATNFFEGVNTYSSAIVHGRLGKLPDFVDKLCVVCNIHYRFDSLEPLDKLVSYMRDLHEKENQRLLKNFTPENLSPKESKKFHKKFSHVKLRNELWKKESAQKLMFVDDVDLDQEPSKSSGIISRFLRRNLIFSQ